MRLILGFLFAFAFAFGNSAVFAQNSGSEDAQMSGILGLGNSRCSSLLADLEGLSTESKLLVKSSIGLYIEGALTMFSLSQNIHADLEANYKNQSSEFRVEVVLEACRNNPQHPFILALTNSIDSFLIEE